MPSPYRNHKVKDNLLQVLHYSLGSLESATLTELMGINIKQRILANKSIKVININRHGCMNEIKHHIYSHHHLIMSLFCFQLQGVKRQRTTNYIRALHNNSEFSYKPIAVYECISMCARAQMRVRVRLF